MVFAKGGYTVGTIGSEFFSIVTPGSRDARTRDQSGWFLGAGVEYAVTKNWSVGAEYQHLDFGTATMGPPVPVTDVTRYVSAHLDLVRARLTYTFSSGQ